MGLRSKVSNFGTTVEKCLHTRLSSIEETKLMGLFQSMLDDELAVGTYGIEMYQRYMYVRIYTTDYSEYGDIAPLLRDLDALKKKRGHIVSKDIFIDRIDKDQDSRTRELCQKWKVRYWKGITLPDQDIAEVE